MQIQITEVRTMWRQFHDREQQAEGLAEAIAQILNAAIYARGRASLVVPGGSTPRAMLHHLAQKDIRWQALWMTLSDERWVDPKALESNECMLRQEFLRGAPGEANFIGLLTDHKTAAAAAPTTDLILRALPMPFDAVVLGMGMDGHVASLFPGMPDIAEALNPRSLALTCAAEAPVEPRERMSLTLAALARTRHLFLLISGQDKADKLQMALNCEPHLPVAHMLRAVGTRAQIFWAP